MKNKLIFLLFIVMFICSCSTNKILNEKLELSLSEKTELEVESLKMTHDVRFFKLNKIILPTQESLYHEGGFQNTEIFDSDFNLLLKVINDDLSGHERKILNKNCSKVLKPFNILFPLTSSTLPCIPWWNDAVTNQRRSNNQKSPEVILPLIESKSRNKFSSYHGYPLSKILKSMKFEDKEDLLKLSKKSTRYFANCAYQEVTAALLLKLEILLPSEEVVHEMDRIYNISSKCFENKNETSEKIHLRMGMFYLIQGRADKAKKVLLQTQLALKPKENTRTFFWLGVISEIKKDIPARDKYWEKLIRSNPISFQAIVAALKLKKDPMSFMSKDEDFIAQNRVEGAWNQTNIQLYILDYLIAKKRTTEAQKWAKIISKTTNEGTAGVLLYLSYLNSQLNNPSSSILLLSKYYKNYDNYPVSPEILKILYPVYFAPEILGLNSEIDPIFILSLIRQESAFDPNAHSSANARGLMQILPSTAKAFIKKIKPQELFDPSRNLVAGSSYLRFLINRYGGRLDYALAAYNAGENALDIWLTRVPTENALLFIDYIPYRETRNYVSIILRNYYWYNRIISENKNDISKLLLEKSEKSKLKSDEIIFMSKKPFDDKNEKKLMSILDNVFLINKNVNP